MFRKLCWILPIFALFACNQNEVELEDIVEAEWDLHVRKCGNYYTSYDAKLKLESDSTSKTGYFAEKNQDTVFFNYILSGETAIITDSATHSNWQGELKVIDFSANKLVIRKSSPDCLNEELRFTR